MKNTEIIWSDKKRTLFGKPISFTLYTLYKEKLVVKRGFLSVNEEEVRLYRITDISLHQTLYQRIFRVGTIKCCSSDRISGDFEIKSVKNPKEIKDLLSDMIEEERMRKGVINIG